MYFFFDVFIINKLNNFINIPDLFSFLSFIHNIFEKRAKRGPESVSR
jgi:hypothetical protein